MIHYYKKGAGRNILTTLYCGKKQILRLFTLLFFLMRSYDILLCTYYIIRYDFAFLLTNLLSNRPLLRLRWDTQVLSFPTLSLDVTILEVSYIQYAGSNTYEDFELKPIKSRMFVKHAGL